MFENKVPRTELSSLGEFGLIDHIAKSIHLTGERVLKGIGDDAAVIEHGGATMVISKDLLIEGVHFDLAFHPLKHLGFKAVAVNVSDLCAMNATATEILVGVAISNRFSLEAVEELYEGMQLACQKYNVNIVGGDTTSSRSGLMISITVLGTATKEQICYRTGAAVNDLICVTGDLGAAYMGLQILEREKRIFLESPNVQPNLSGNDYILERQLKPEARVDQIKKLAELGVKPTSMIDISDGLASELMHLCKNSQVGAVIYESKLPIDGQTYERAREFGIDPTVAAVNGGEDYELLFTLQQQDYEKIRPHADVSIIGYITEVDKGIKLMDKSDNEVVLKAQGWNHF
jgi:thiamine-monophosphate kinase